MRHFQLTAIAFASTLTKLRHVTSTNGRYNHQMKITYFTGLSTGQYNRTAPRDSITGQSRLYKQELSRSRFAVSGYR